eukprot:417829-Prymnesium_polylepis.1
MRGALCISELFERHLRVRARMSSRVYALDKGSSPGSVTPRTRPTGISTRKRETGRYATPYSRSLRR